MGRRLRALHYFNTHADKLTADQAARLAVILPNPLEWSAAPPGPYVLEQARIIRRRIGQITPLLTCTH